MPTKFYRSLLAFLIVFLLSTGVPAVSAQGQSPVFTTGPELVIMANPAYSGLRIPAPGPTAAFAPRRNAAGDIAVTFLDPVHPDIDGSPCLNFPPDAQAAYLFAANIWASYINTPRTIHISACWRQLPTGALGSAGPALVANATGLPKSGRWYPLALADFLTDSVLYPGTYDITSRFTSDIGPSYGPWYFGTNGNTPFGSYDFTSVVLHEIGHGLGFTGTMTDNNNTGLGSYNLCAGQTCYPSVYDDFTQAENGTPLLNMTNNSSQLGAALTSGAYFSGPKTTSANGGQRAQLYTPLSWMQGSSYSHLAESFNGTPNALMTFSLNNGESVHDPGPVTLGILGDLGWVISTGTNAPAAPSGLNASASSASQVNLSWSDNSSNETGFQIQRSLDGNTWTAVTTAAANATSYPDNGLIGGTQYSFRIRAVSGTLTSAYSNTAAAITLGPPPPPGAPGAAASSDTQINLSWQDRSNIETGYKIERSDDLGATWNPLVTTAANATSYPDLGLEAGKAYQYRISTASAQGDSASAGPVSASTWAVVNHSYQPLIVR